MDALARMLRGVSDRPQPADDALVRRLEVRAAQLSAENRRIRARYDAAQTTAENRKHWAAADGLSANAANSDAVRKTLRERARYETASNSYAQGIALTLANDTVGTGPRLQMLTASEADNERIEALFQEWAEADDLAGKLRTLRMARFQDGEGFARLMFDTSRPFSAWRLTVRLIECDRVASPLTRGIDQPVDGIVLDTLGNPVAYQVLRDHPGDHFLTGATWEADRIPASEVLHYFVALRPEQARGIPEITPALHLFAQLRRYTLAVIAAAEVAADHAAVLQSKMPPDGNAATEVAEMETFELEPRMVTTLPEGWELSQLRAEQPTTTFGDFRDKLINELGRCLNMPFNVAACNSAAYNFASGRLDHLIYHRAIGIERKLMERAILNRILVRWFREGAALGLLPGELFQRPSASMPSTLWQWFWPGTEYIDPEGEAKAQETRLRTGMSTRADEFGRRGRDWRKEGAQLMAERLADIRTTGALLKEARKVAKDAGLPEDALVAMVVPAAAAGSMTGSNPAGGDTAEAKARLDAVGLAVRSGLLTPQEADEDATRSALSLPPMGTAARKAWSEEPTRRPVTLVQEGGPSAPGVPPGSQAADATPQDQATAGDQTNGQ